MIVEKQSEVIASIINVFASYCRSIFSLCNSASECVDVYEKYQKAFLIVSGIVLLTIFVVSRLTHRW